MQLNLLPSEYAAVQEDAQDCANTIDGRFQDAEFARRMWLRFGCSSFRQYEVVVRYDVPAIPWLTRGVQRFGPDRNAWGGGL